MESAWRSVAAMHHVVEETKRILRASREADEGCCKTAALMLQEIYECREAATSPSKHTRGHPF